MNQIYVKALSNLVKDEFVVNALKEHFRQIHEELRPTDIDKLTSDIIAAQTRTFISTGRVLDLAFKRLNDFKQEGNTSADENDGL